MDLNGYIYDWQKEFPFLKKYSDRTLFMIAKPFLIGLRLLKGKYDKKNTMYI